MKFLNLVETLLIIYILTVTSQGYTLAIKSSRPSSHSSHLVVSSKDQSRQRWRRQPTRLSTTSTKDDVDVKAITTWPSGDALDKHIIQLALPTILNFAIQPIVGAADTYFVGRMKDPLALAGQGAANQVFTSIFWLMSFLPSIVSPLVANAAGAGDLEGVQERVGEAVFLASILGLSGMFCLTLFPHKALNIVLATDAPVRVFATPYLAIRALTILPAMLSTVAFAAFRGTQEFVTPLKISLAANLVNFCLDPLLIFKGKMGVTGAAAATCASELVSFVLFARTLVKRKMVRASRLFKPPSFTKLKPILLGGLGVQARIVSVNAALLTVTRTTQMVDKTGTAAAAHAITSQLWQLGGIFLLAMSTVAGIIVPTEAAKAKRDGYPEGLLQARKTANRLLAWGLICGIALGGIQLMMLPLLAGLAPTPEVSKAARVPSIIASVMQIMNGVMFVGEGIQTGNQAFTSLALCTAVGSLAMITCLRSLGNSLVGVWIGYSVFTVIRLMGVLRHHFLTGPLAPKHIGREYLLAKHGLEGAK